MPNNDEASYTEERIQSIAINSFIMDRTQIRLMKTLSLFAQKTGQGDILISAYYETIKNEKERLLKLVDKQLKKVIELNAPSHIIEDMEKKHDLVKEIVDNLNQKESKVFFEETINDINDQINDKLLGMTTAFVDNKYEIAYMDNESDSIDQLNELYKT